VFQALVALYHLPLTPRLGIVVVVVVAVVVVVVAVAGVVVVVVAVAVVVVTDFVDKAGAICGVGSDVVTVEPFLLVAVTTTRKVCPTSAAARRY
jgi:hypothetical protein